MSKLVMRVAHDWRRKPMIVIAICIAWCALLVISIKLGIEDYTTSVLGYQALPTKKTNETIAYLVGALPMLLQVAFGFWAIEKNNRLAALVTIAAFFVDVSTDVYYKAVDQTITMYVVATVESVVLFTLGTEFLFLAALENIGAYLPEAISAIGLMMNKMASTCSDVFHWFLGSNRNERDEY